MSWVFAVIFTGFAAASPGASFVHHYLCTFNFLFWNKPFANSKIKTFLFMGGIFAISLTGAPLAPSGAFFIHHFSRFHSFFFAHKSILLGKRQTFFSVCSNVAICFTFGASPAPPRPVSRNCANSLNFFFRH